MSGLREISVPRRLEGGIATSSSLSPRQRGEGWGEGRTLDTFADANQQSPTSEPLLDFAGRRKQICFS
jgi:hypothetical protein